MATITDRRGRAIAGAFGFVAASFLLNYLTQFWKPLEPFGWLSVMRYDRPMSVLRDGAWPVRDLFVLGSATAAAWVGAGWIFARRDLATT